MAIKEMEQGLHNGNLGGGLFKKRIAAKSHGKSGGDRALVAVRREEMTFFLEIFSKNEKENLDQKELAYLKQLSKLFLSLTEYQISELLKQGELLEIPYGE